MDLEEFAQDLLQDVHAESDADGEFLEDVFFQKSCDQLTEAGELETADRVLYRSPARGIRVGWLRRGSIGQQRDVESHHSGFSRIADRGTLDG